MLDSIFEPGVTGVSPFAIMLSLYLAYYVHNDARNHNNPRALLWAFATLWPGSFSFPYTGLKICEGENNLEYSRIPGPVCGIFIKRIIKKSFFIWRGVWKKQT